MHYVGIIGQRAALLPLLTKCPELTSGSCSNGWHSLSGVSSNLSALVGATQAQPGDAGLGAALRQYARERRPEICALQVGR
jgi:hypothetical protein